MAAGTLEAALLSRAVGKSRRISLTVADGQKAREPAPDKGFLYLDELGRIQPLKRRSRLQTDFQGRGTEVFPRTEKLSPVGATSLSIS